MKKVLISIFILLLAFQFISADLEITKSASDNSIIVGVNKPATFDLEVKNTGESNYFEFYNLLGFSMYPKGTTFISKGQTKDVKLEIYPLEEPTQRGLFTFQYYIKGENATETSDKLTVNIIELGEAFKVGSGEIDPDASSIEIYIENKENYKFEKINAGFSSAFFEFDKEFSLKPFEKKTFDIDINKDDIKKLMAGFYTLKVEIEANGKTDETEGTIKFAEKDLISTTKEDYGFFINTQIIKKENKGNVLSESETVIKKNIISRLFTTITPEPDVVERQAATVYYTWARDIKPGETLEISVKTNWLFPLAVILLIVAIAILTKQYSAQNMILRKRVNFVRTKGGEFALRISISVKAKKYLERVNIIDRIPHMVKVHERFGTEVPSRLNEKTGRIEWNYEKLEPGEVRVLSYIVYSKIGILGKFALPTATAIFERDGKIHETQSNRAYFIAETRGGEKEDFD